MHVKEIKYLISGTLRGRHISVLTCQIASTQEKVERGAIHLIFANYLFLSRPEWFM